MPEYGAVQYRPIPCLMAPLSHKTTVCDAPVHFVAVLQRESEYHTPLCKYNTVGAPTAALSASASGRDGGRT